MFLPFRHPPITRARYLGLSTIMEYLPLKGTFSFYDKSNDIFEYKW